MQIYLSSSKDLLTSKFNAFSYLIFSTVSAGASIELSVQYAVLPVQKVYFFEVSGVGIFLSSVITSRGGMFFLSCSGEGVLSSDSGMLPPCFDSLEWRPVNIVVSILIVCLKVKKKPPIRADRGLRLLMRMGSVG